MIELPKRSEIDEALTCWGLVDVCRVCIARDFYKHFPERWYL